MLGSIWFALVSLHQVILRFTKSDFPLKNGMTNNSRQAQVGLGLSERTAFSPEGQEAECVGQDVQAGCAAESGGSGTQSPGPCASSLGNVARAGEMDHVRKWQPWELSVESCGATTASTTLGRSRVPFLLCILSPGGLAWVVHASCTPMLVTVAQELGPAGAPGPTSWFLDH